MREYDIADAALAEEGQARIEWAARSMPVLQEIRTKFLASAPLAGLRIAACLHVTPETANLILTLAAGGAEVNLCASNPSSTRDDVAAALVINHGINVFARSYASPAQYYANINQALNCRPQLLLDDGADLVVTLHRDRADLLDGVYGGCEETTTGVTRLRAMERESALRIPMLAVNDTDTKHMFDNRYGTGQSTIDAILRATNILLAGKVVVVAGYGFGGKGIAERARGMGCDVIVTEIDPVKALDAAMSSYRVMPMATAARWGEVFITVTGNRDVIRAEHMLTMQDGAILCNSGHFNVEVDCGWLDANTVSKRRLRDHVEEYVFADGRRLVLLSEGRVVNLGAAEGHPASVMDLSFSDQALTVEWLARNHENLPAGVHAVPSEIDREVASLKLAAMGIEIDLLTNGQTRYLQSWEYGS